MTIPGITEIASQDLFGWGNIPKFTGDLWFVDAGAGVSGNGQLPDTAFLTIAEGIAAAAAGDGPFVADPVPTPASHPRSPTA